MLGGQPRLHQHGLDGDAADDDHHPPEPAGGRPEQFPATTNSCDNAGTAPITRASGKSRVVLAHARNAGSPDATYQSSPPSPAHPERGSSTTTNEPEEQPTTPHYAP